MNFKLILFYNVIEAKMLGNNIFGSKIFNKPNFQNVWNNSEKGQNNK